MRGKIALVTGATDGIGFYTALGLAERGFEVLVTGRDVERGRRAELELRRRAGQPAVHFLQVDHASLLQNRALGALVAERWPRLDVLVNNAGGLCDVEGSVDEYEPSLVLNFLAPFALTDSLTASLAASEDARIVNVVSRAHASWTDDPFRVLDARPSSPFQAYARATLLNLLWTFSLCHSVEDPKIAVNAANPGMAWTPGTRRWTPAAVPSWRTLWPLRRWLQRRASPERAARASIALATDVRFRAVRGLYVGCDGRAQRPSVAARNERWQEQATSLALRLVARVATGPHTAPRLRATG